MLCVHAALSPSLLLSFSSLYRYRNRKVVFPRRQLLLAPGPRILTFFLYLSDVEEGGETAFPDLGHTGGWGAAMYIYVCVMYVQHNNILPMAR
jgi:hypothetical protein